MAQLNDPNNLYSRLRISNPLNFNQPTEQELFNRQLQENAPLQKELETRLDSVYRLSPNSEADSNIIDSATVFMDLFDMNHEQALGLARTTFSTGLTKESRERMGFGQALGQTALNTFNQFSAGTNMALYMIGGNDEHKTKALEKQGKIVNLWEDYGFLGNTVLSSVQPLGSSLRYMGTTALLRGGSALLARAIGVSHPILATATFFVGTGLSFLANISITGLSQAGSDFLEYSQMADKNGTKLDLDSPEAKTLFWTSALAHGTIESIGSELLPGVRYLNETIDSVARNAILKESWKQVLMRVALGTPVGIIGEGFEEFLAVYNTALTENSLKYLANKEGASFDYTSGLEMATEGWKAFTDGAVSMIIPSILTGALGGGVYNARTKAAARANFNKTEGSVSIDRRYIEDVPKPTAPKEGEIQKSTAKREKLDPVKLVDVGGTTPKLVALNAAEREKLGEAAERNAEAVEAVIVDQEPLSVEDRQSLVNRAALATGGKLSGDRIVYETSEDVERAKVLLDPVSIQGDTVTFRDEDGDLVSLEFAVAEEGMDVTEADISYYEDPEAPHSLARMTQDKALEYQERKLIKEAIGNVVEHTGGRISNADLEANVDAVKMVAETLNIPTDELLGKGVAFRLVDKVYDTAGKEVNARGSIESNISIEGQKQYTINISKTADATTILHELGHTLRGLATDEQIRDFRLFYGKGKEAAFVGDINKVGDKFYVGEQAFDTLEQAQKLVEANEEAFANDFVAYLRTGQAPTADLRNIFARMKAVLNRFLAEFGYRLDPAVRQAFDNLLGRTGEALHTTGMIPSDAEGNVLFQAERDFDWDDIYEFVPDGYDAYFNGGHAYITEVENRNSYRDTEFDGLFASKDIDNAGGHGDILNAFIIADEDVATSRELDNEYDKVLAFLERELELTPDDEHFHDIYNAIVWDVDTDEVNEAIEQHYEEKLAGTDIRYEYPGWFSQRMRGRLAAELGYKAVEMSDEHGTSYHISPGVQAFIPPVDSKADVLFQQAPAVGSDEFKQLFDGSKVVDKNGNPLLVHHGSRSLFNTFTATQLTDFGYLGAGFYFSGIKDVAKMYAGKNNKGYIYNAYLVMKNPLLWQDAWKEQWDVISNNILKKYPSVKKYSNEYSVMLAIELREMGYDGVLDMVGDVVNEAVVFDDKQVLLESTENYGLGSNTLYQSSADERYFKALEAGDEETARKIVDDMARQKGYISGNDFRMNHKAPNSHDGFSARLDQLDESELLPNGFWGHPSWFTSDDRELRSFWKIKEAYDRYKKNGSAKIRLYRAIPKNVKEDWFRNGDWVTPDREYADDEGAGIPGGYRIIVHQVPIEHVWWDVNSTAELGYDDGGDYAYRDTKNNRKLNDMVVRDDDGNIVPPSKRFNYRSYTLYQLSPEAKQQLLEERKKDVQDAVENHFWVSSRILEEYLDEEWAQKEMATREYLEQFPWMLEEARQFTTPEEYLQFIETMSEDAIEKGEQYKLTPEDADWYRKIFAYARIQSPQDLDKQFVDNFTKDKKSIAQLARAIKTYQDIGNRKVSRHTKLKENSRIVVWKWGTFKGVSPYVKNFTEKSSDEDFERAKKLIQENPRAYRKALRTVSEAEERVMAFKTHSSTSSYGYSREAYYDELDEDMLAALDEPLLLSEMTDREAAEYLRTTSNKQERFNAREKLATHMGVYAMELQADAEVKRLGEVKDSEIKKLQKQRERLASELKETGEQFKKARKELRSTESALEKERARSWELIEKLDEKSKQASKVNQLEKDLADRRARVKELRTQLTEKSREARRLNRQVTAYENREEARKTREKIERLMKVAYVAIKVSPSMDASYHPVFGWVQERLGLTSEYSKPDAPWKKKVDMLEDYLPRDVLDMLSAGIQINQWPVEALQALVDGMRMLQRQARIEGAYRADQTRMRRDRIALEYDRQTYGYTPMETDQSIESVMGEIRDRLDNRKQNFYNGKEGKAAKVAHVFRQSFAHIWSFSTWLDGQKENGIMFKTFGRTVWEYYQEEFRNVQRRLSAFDDIRKQMGYNQKRLAKKVFSYTTPGGNEVALNLEQAITAYIYSLNEKGLKKLIHASGNGMSHAILADLYQVLSEEDRQFAQAMIDAAGGDAEYMRLAEVFYRVYNHDLSREQNYFRFRAAGVEMENDIDLAKGIRKERFSYVEKGFGEDRTEAIYPLNLNGMKNLTKTIEEQEHLIHFGEWVRDANYLLGPKGSLGHEVRVTYGDTSLKTLQTFVKRIAGAQDTISDFEKMLNNLITQVSSSLISANLSSMMKQAASMSYVLMGDISLPHAVRCMCWWSPTPEIRNWVHAYEVMCELDPSMKERTFDIEVKRSRNLEYTTKASRALAKIRDTGIKYTTQLGDSLITVKMWWGAYLTALDKYSNMEEAGRMREAVFYASRFIAETQSSSNPMDLAEIQTSRHTWQRLISAFKRDAFKRWNLAFYKLPQAVRNRHWARAGGIITSQLLGMFILAGVSGIFVKKDDDDEEKHRRFLIKNLIAQLFEESIPYAGEGIASGIRGFSGDGLLKLDDVAGRWIGEVFDGDEDWDAFWKRSWELAITSLSTVGVPSLAVERTIKSVDEMNFWRLIGGYWYKLGEDE